MKIRSFLSFAAVLFGTSAMSQTVTPPNDELSKSFDRYFGTVTAVPVKKIEYSDISKIKNGQILVLSEDHMPCMVPDLSSVSPIPNAALQNDEAINIIPNPYRKSKP